MRPQEPDPVPLFVEEHGDGGTTLLLLHGFGATGFTWRNWVPELARAHRVLVADLKGFGRSPKPRDGRYSPHDHARAVQALLDAQRLDSVTLVGHSLGGGVALLTALRLLDRGQLHRIRALVLVASAAYPQALPPFVSLARLRVLASLALTVLPTAAVVRRVIAEIVTDVGCVTDDLVNGYADPLRGSAARYGLLNTALQIIPPDVPEVVARFPELDLPVKLVWGESDRVVPLWVGQRLHEALPRSSLDVLAGCGHLPTEEHPVASLELVTRFLAGV